MIYGLLERVFILRQKKWIDEAAWQEWAPWLVNLARNPVFVHVHTISRGMFDASFQEHVSRVVTSASTATESSRSETRKR